MARPLEGGEGRRQGVLHQRGGQLVQRDRDLPDGPDETREHPRYTHTHALHLINTAAGCLKR